MKILYVTPLWSGLKDILLDGALIAKGMPAFIIPLKRLIELGHEVDIVVAIGSDDAGKDFNISVEWLDNSRIIFTSWETDGYKKITSIFKLLSVVNHLLKENKYDFVYAHGSIGVIANMVANYQGIPCGMRLYGTFLASKIKQLSRIRIAIRHPLEYMAFKLSKSFLLITNDGTKGDQVYNYLTKKQSNYEFYFMLNGVDLVNTEPISEKVTGIEQIKMPFIIYPARIARWKRQHLAIDILKGLHENGLLMHLYFAGHITEPDYWNEIENKVIEYGLDPYVTYLGAVDNKTLYYLYKNSEAVLSLYDFSNLGNVVIESLSCGALVLSLDDGSLDAIITSEKNAILVDDTSEAVRQILYYNNNKDKTLKMRKLAKQKASETFKDWKTRAEEEIKLIENAINKSIYRQE